MTEETKKLYEDLRAKMVGKNQAEISRQTGIHKTILSRFFTRDQETLNFENTTKLKGWFESNNYTETKNGK